MPAPKLLKQEHASRTADRRADWTFAEDHYRGGREFLRKITAMPSSGGEAYLVRGIRETQDAYVKRARRTHYANITREVVSRLVGFLYSSPVTRPEPKGNGNAQDIYKSVMANVDMAGTGPTEFFKEAMRWRLVRGAHYVFVDEPVLPEHLAEARLLGREISVEDLIKAKVYPYLIPITAHDMLDWGPSDKAPTWCKFRVTRQSTRNRWDDPTPKKVVEYVCADETSLTFFSEKGELVRTVKHNAGRMPVVPLQPVWLDGSPIEDVFTMANCLLNLDSEIVQLVLDYVFSLLAIEGDRVEGRLLNMGTNPDKPGEAAGLTEKGPNRLFYHAPGTDPPTYVGPQAGSLDAVLSYRAHLVGEIFRRAFLQSSLRVEKFAETAEAKRRDWQDTEQGLVDLAVQMEQAEQAVQAIVVSKLQAITNQVDFGVPAIAYPKQFDLADLLAALDEFERMLDLPLGGEFKEAAGERLIRKVFPTRDVKTMVDQMKADLKAAMAFKTAA